MEAERVQPVDYVADIVVMSKDEQVILLVEVKSKKIQDLPNIQKYILPIKHYLRNCQMKAHYNLANNPFILFVNLDSRIIFEWNIYEFSAPLIYLKTDAVLSNYDQGIKVFLSSNTKDFDKPKVQEALRNAGIIKYFIRPQDFLGWLQFQNS